MVHIETIVKFDDLIEMARLKGISQDKALEIITEASEHYRIIHKQLGEKYTPELFHYAQACLMEYIIKGDYK